MYEWIRSFSSLADAMMMMMRDNGVGSVYYYGIALTVIILATSIASRKDDRPFQKLFSRALKNAAKSEHLAHSALKTCPKCALQLPLSTLVCETCDYNFLSGSVGTRHKLLPAPDAATSTG